ncbi:MAG: hypothetical protein H6985_11490 [Pseudomonadales bacterium]|nr:hypothetical protein [Pseudomonadales bacterium]
MPTPTNYILIDFENVQPRNLELLKQQPFKVFVFIGENQSKVPFALAEAMQCLGDNGKYIKISGSGPNALDFHIAYYIGQLAAQDQEGYFHVISKDQGFDPLIRHLRGLKIKAARQKDLAEIPLLRISNAVGTDEKVKLIVTNLSGRGQSRPRKQTTLANTIDSLFTKSLGEHESLSLIKELEQRKYITINGGNVSYQLPETSKANPGL